MTSRASRRIVWKESSGPDGLVPFGEGGGRFGEGVSPDTDLPWVARERVIQLLHVGAEIEHALMAQYLYAALSLGGEQVPPEHRPIVEQWRKTITEIVREEMAHLVTVENLLQLIGGPLTFEREDFPVTSPFYPFPFTLEQLTRKSLAKYILAEAPREDSLSKELRDELAAVRVDAKLHQKETIAGSQHVNRVGELYATIRDWFIERANTEHASTDPSIDAADIQGASVSFQAQADEWAVGFPELLVLVAGDRKSALDALLKIAKQGEGVVESPEEKSQRTLRQLDRGARDADIESSHFGRFLNIYRNFPQEGQWSPSRPVATNPTTLGKSKLEETSTITNNAALPWAQLANVRYRMVLSYLSHALLTESPLAVGERSARGLLISWAFGEMYNLRSISDVLTSLPMLVGGAMSYVAGLPLEMPSTLALPPREPDRWRVHRDNLRTSQILIADARKVTQDERRLHYLTGLGQADAAALTTIRSVIGI